MRIHRMSKDEIDACSEFITAIDEMLKIEKFYLRAPYEKWKEWDDEYKDEIINLRSRIAKDEDIEESQIDGRIVAYEYLRKKYYSRLFVLLITASALLDSVCDNNKDYLDMHPCFVKQHVAPEQ